MTTISRLNVLRTYRFYAPLYDYVFGMILDPGRREVARIANALAPETLLEVGVGTGLGLPMYRAETSVTGIDLCPEMLTRARRRASGLRGRTIDLAVMDAEHMDFDEAQFDCVVVSYVLSVTPDVDQLVSEVRRVCKKGGRIVILNHFSGNRAWWFLERITSALADRIGFRSDFGFQEQIVDRKWKVLSVTPVNIFGLSRVVVVENE